MNETPNTSNHRPVGDTCPPDRVTLAGALSTIILPAMILFSTWSLRRRVGQVLPVAIAFLLLVSVTQTIGTLHDISSVATRQQIAQSWRGPYDLFIRPQSAVSLLERTAGWIDPQSILESYGGINDKQIATIRSLPHVAAVTPVANLGWQSIAVQIPVTLASKGIYRISATWVGQGTTTPAVTRYVDVTDLNALTTEISITDPVVTHLIVSNNATSIIFPMSIQAIQAVIGIPAAQQTTLADLLSQGIAPAPAVHLSLHIDKLSGNLSILSTCLHNAVCWMPQSVRQGAITYQPDGVQLLRYSHTNYTATPQQLTDGQVVVEATGADVQGALYRRQLPAYVAVPANQPGYSQETPLHVLPFSAPEHLPLVANAIRFMPLEQACTINGVNCYNGLYIRLDGVENYSQSSLALLQATAAAIAAHTGLHVAILDGSSLRTVSLTTSSASSHQLVQSSWRVVGVAVQIVSGLDAIQEILLLLCSIVCLLAIAAAGILVGIGRSKDILLLRQLGWQQYLLLCVLILDALFLCCPGCLLVITWIILMTNFWPNSLPPWFIWLLLASGIGVYCCTLVGIAATASNRDKNKHQINVHRHLTHARITIPCVLGLTLFAVVFLIANEYILLTNFNQVLVVTVLGSQVRTALEAPQLALLLLILLSACLTIGLCAILILQGRREEIALLAKVGWQRQDVLLRLMRNNWPIALLSGEAAVVFALAIMLLGGASTSFVNALCLLLSGPLLGLLLVNVATLGPAWQATKRVYP